MKRNNDKMKLSAEGQSGLIALISNHPNNVRAAAIEMASRLKLSPSTDLANIIAGSKTIAAEVSQPVESRVLAINVLGLDPSGIPFPLLERLLQSDQPSDIQLAVANVLLRNQQDASTNILLNKWNTFNPKVHEVVETGFLARTERVKSLVKAIESDKIKPTWISRNTQNRLLKYSDTTIRETAKKIFKDTGEGNREQVILDYNVSTTRNGDPVKGKTVFKTVCSVCHLLDGVGVNFGPDLHSISHQTKINLLTMILNPNHDIAAGYEGYTIETTDGRAFAGIIESESDNNIILKSPGGVVQTILKSDVKSMAPMPGSLMPEGLETSVNKDDMADLIEYIKTLK
jgi:putative heme-binding domain-containing protein